MKNLMFVIGCFFSITCYASNNLQITGDAAKNLLTSLEDVGAYVDCGVGTCGTVAQSVSCEMKGNSVEQRSYQCVLSAQNDAGDFSPVIAYAPHAESLFNSLVNSGLQSDCGAGTCTVDASMVHCLRYDNNDQYTYECSITAN